MGRGTQEKACPAIRRGATFAEVLLQSAFAAARKAAEEVPDGPDHGPHDQERRNAAAQQGSRDPQDYKRQDNFQKMFHRRLPR